MADLTNQSPQDPEFMAAKRKASELTIKNVKVGDRVILYPQRDVTRPRAGFVLEVSNTGTLTVYNLQDKRDYVGVKHISSPDIRHRGQSKNLHAFDFCEGPKKIRELETDIASLKEAIRMTTDRLLSLEKELGEKGLPDGSSKGDASSGTESNPEGGDRKKTSSRKASGKS